MDYLTLQARIYKGCGKVAQHIGEPVTAYRPANAASPLAVQVGSFLCSFNNKDMSYTKPNKYGDPLWFGVFDASASKAGDYLAGSSMGLSFIAAMQLNLPVLVVSCNRMVRIERPAPHSAAVGAVPYRATETVKASGMVDVLGSVTTALLDINTVLGQVVLTGSGASQVLGWPCSLLRGKGRSGQGQPDRLPTSVSQAGWDMLLPASVPIQVETGDFVVDDLGSRYQVGSAELTDLGWRVSLTEVHT